MAHIFLFLGIKCVHVHSTILALKLYVGYIMMLLLVLYLYTSTDYSSSAYNSTFGILFDLTNVEAFIHSICYDKSAQNQPT